MPIRVYIHWIFLHPKKNRTHYTEKYGKGISKRKSQMEQVYDARSVLTQLYIYVLYIYFWCMNADKTIWIIQPIQLSTIEQHAMRMVDSITRRV